MKLILLDTAVVLVLLVGCITIKVQMPEGFYRLEPGVDHVYELQDGSGYRDTENYPLELWGKREVPKGGTSAGSTPIPVPIPAATGTAGKSLIWDASQGGLIWQ